MMTPAARRQLTRPVEPGAQSREVRQARLLSLLGSRAPESEVAARALATVSDATLDGWLASLERYQSACGCKSGAAVGLLALALWPVWALRRQRMSTVQGAAVGLGFWAGAGVGGAVVGKLGGLAVAAAARRSLIRRIVTGWGAEVQGPPARASSQSS